MSTNHPAYKILAILVIIGLLSATFPLTTRAAAPAGLPNAPLNSPTPPAAPLNATPAGPLSLARVQSAYVPASTISNTLVLTFTVANTQLPTGFPELSPSATVTEALAVFNDFDYSSDPNTLRNVILVDTLTPSATYAGASPTPDQDGSTYLFNLGDIPPLGSARVAITLTVPASVAGETLLDNGATAYASQQGRLVSATTTPAALLPDNLGDWLIWTPDVDIYDADMLQAVAAIGADPASLFAAVRSLSYEAYNGSLRGTRGTLWSSAGNSADQASLLIAMLRSSGIPARYRHGSLTPAGAQTLIANMFPTPTRTLGQVPDALPTADPLNDASLLALAQDHWWVEAYLPGSGWTDLDPTFASASVGQSFVLPGSVASDGTDRIAELPDTARHKVTMRLKVESYHPLNPGNGGLAYTYPLSHTFNTVELTGNPVTLAHLVNGNSLGGLVYTSVDYSYTPYFQLDKDQGSLTIEGSAYQELFTNFPFGSSLKTGLWWQFDVRPPNGPATSYERTLVDRIGPAGRLNGGQINLEINATNDPILDDTMIFQVLAGPGTTPLAALTNQIDNLVPASTDFMATIGTLVNGDSSAPDFEAQQRAAAAAYRAWGIVNLEAIATTHYAQSDYAAAYLANSMLVKSYPAGPRLIIASQGVNENGDLAVSLDLLKDDVVAYAYPGQNRDMGFAFLGARGVMESQIEGLAVEKATGLTPITTSAIFRAATAQPDFDLAIITGQNLDDLATLAISDEAKARITQAALAGKIISVPSQMVTIDGQSTIGWWESDPASGAVQGVLENGLRGALEYEFLAEFSARYASFIGGFSGQFAKSLFEFVGNVLNIAIAGNPVDLKDLLNKMYIDMLIEVIAFVTGKLVQIENPAVAAGVGLGLGMLKTMLQNCVAGDCGKKDGYLQAAIDAVTGVLAQMFFGIPIGDFISAGQAAGKFGAFIILDYVSDIDPPLPASLISITPAPAPLTPTRGTVAVADAFGSQTLSGSAIVRSLTLSDTTGTASLYAPAGDGIAAGGTLSALGITNFAPTANLTTTAGDLRLDLLSSSLLLGGTPLNAPNGLAATSFSGTLAVAENNSSSDSVLLDGSASLFTLDVTPAGSTTDPVTPITFQANVTANFASTFTLTVSAPAGWTTTLSPSGQVSAAPPLGATPGGYTLTVSATPASAPGRSVAANHLVTITPYDGVTAAINPDPLLTVPWGPQPPDALPGNPNNGQIQLTGAAYTIDITNTSTLSRTFDVTLGSLPAGWGLLDGQPGSSNTSRSLPAGAVGQIGLYISPTVATLPPAGTSYPFTLNVQAQDNPAVNASDSASFTVPALPYPHLQYERTLYYAAPNSTVTVTAAITNIGNSPATFPITNTLTALDGLASPTVTPAAGSAALAAGAASSFNLLVDTSGTTPGELYGLRSETTGGPYTLIDAASLIIVNPAAICAYDAATAVAAAGDPLVAGALDNLAPLLNAFAANLTDLAARDALVTALNDLINLLPANLPAGAELTPIAANLAAHTDPGDLAADLADLCAALSNLALQIEIAAQYSVAARFTPGYSASLPGSTTPITLTVSNNGSSPTTYSVDLTLPGGPTSFNTTLQPGESADFVYSLTPAGTGLTTLEATITALDAAPLLLQTTVRAGLNIVDRFIQLTAVTPDPAFVETGSSSTTIDIAVNNVANVQRAATARTTILAPGGAISHTSDLPLTLFTGPPRTYPLGSVDTTGWATGVYTVAVQLLDSSSTLIPDGSGYGYLRVGQALGIRHDLNTTLVPPGTFTVTTHITSEILIDAIVTGDAPLGFANATPGEPITFTEPLSDTGVQPTLMFRPPISDTAPFSETGTLSETTPGPDSQQSIPLAPTATDMITVSPGLYRYEETDPGIVYGGTWNNVNSANYSSGSGLRTEGIGNTATFSFTGQWLEIGLGETTDAGKVEVTLDGVSQGVYDLYGRNETRALIFPNLSSGPHVVTLTVVAQDNPFSNRNWVVLDYLTVWDGTALPDGTFEHDSGRVLTSNGWRTFNNVNASAGTYGDAANKAWFYFMGDSVTIRAITTSDEMRVLVDGQFITKFDLRQTTNPTSTLSLEGFGPGLHVLELDEYRGVTVLDTFTTPGIPPFYQPPPAGSYTRYEEDDPTWLYNGFPFNTTASSWSFGGYGIASNGYAARSDTLSDTISLTFTGTAVFLGFYTSNWGGLAQVTIDGLPQEIVDTYSNEPDLLTRRYANLGAGLHTITVTVLDQRNPFALRDEIRLDFIDVWDGIPLPDGTYEAEDRTAVYTSDNWNVLTDAGASSGVYLEWGDTVWFPFTGDSVSLVLPSDHFSNDMRLFVDDQFIDYFDNFSPNFTTDTLSLDGFGAGAHLLRLESYRSRGLADAFVIPGTAPFWQPPDKSGFFRYEEDDPDLRYNGVPFFQTAISWDRSSSTLTSDGQQVRTTTAGDTVSLTFTGEWVSMGFLGDAFSGEIEVLIDGLSQGVFDLYRHDTDPVTLQFGNLGAGVHTVTAVNLGTKHPNSGSTRLFLDYIDTWDGTPLPQGKIEAEDSTRTYYSSDLGVVNEPDASGGAYVRDGILRQGNLWFPFTGESITLQTWSRDLDMMRLKIDGVEQPPLDLFSTIAQTRTISLEGLSAGIHVLELNRYRSDMNADAFIVPAIPANFPYPPAPQTGIVRYEEDHPALRYNGYVYSQTVGSWDYNASSSISSNYVANTGAAGNSVSLDFDGAWFGVGFDSTVNTGLAEIYLDGQLLDTVDTSGNVGPLSRYYDVVTGTHTISVTAVNPIRVDFIDTWDGTPMPDGWYDADLNDRTAEFHYSTYWATYSDDYAREEDMVGRGLVNTRRAMWFSFTGRDLTFRSYNNNNGQYEIFIDGISQGVYTTTAVYSDQPINWHFPNLGNGPHVFSLLALDGASRTFVDAFHVNPEKFVDAAPSIEWFDFTAGPGGGFLTTMAAGDINNDGIVEIIAPSRDGNLYVYRGDGQDAGSGTPLLWSAPTDVANEPSIADIDLDGYGEILLLSGDGLYAFEHDGATKWMTDTIFSSGAGGSYGWGGVAVGNLDLDSEPELVVAPSQQQAAVISADGATVTRFGPTLGPFPTLPILVDANNDGFLDIVIADDNTLYVYDAFNGLSLLWSYTYDTSDISPNTGSQTWGAPAVANLDTDDDPEIIIFFEEKVVALNHDGTELWVYKVARANGFRPSHVTVADVDGDGEVEIIVAQALSAGLVLLNHEILVLNADGTLLWSEIVDETTSSSSGVATHDFNGDGVWEVLWNGYNDGFLIFNGPDGDRIFNEPRINSGTIVDYPSVADVDGDNFAEVLLGDGEGLWVVGHDDVWANSRPLWSSNSYRITDLNDDLSVPVSEPPSWLVHNTYRTQTSERTPLPAYSVALTHTAGITNVTVLSSTFSTTPDVAADPLYGWDYSQTWATTVVTRSFASRLDNLPPGSSQLVAQGTLASYTLPGGSNALRLPPLYVSVPHLVAITPAGQTTGVGSSITYALTLYNPAGSPATYTLATTGLPGDWVRLPASVDLPANSQTSLLLTITVPDTAASQRFSFAVTVDNGSGGRDQVAANLTVVDPLNLTLSPAAQRAPAGVATPYTLTLTSLLPTPQTVSFSASASLATSSLTFDLPAGLTLGPGETLTLPLTVTGQTNGPAPFSVRAGSASGGSASDSALLTVDGSRGVAVSLAPGSVSGGTGSPLVYTATLQNLGSINDSYDLEVTLPAGWSYTLTANDAPLSQVALPPGPLNSATLRLSISAPAGTAPGSYPISLSASASGAPAISGSAAASAVINNLGVSVAIQSTRGTTLDPNAAGSWQVLVTNSGSIADSYDLSASGFFGPLAQFSPASVSLAPGASQTVDLTTDPATFALQQTYPLVVRATSGSDGQVQAQDQLDVTFSGAAGVDVRWQPASQTIPTPGTVFYELVISNTHNIAADFDLSASLGLLTANLPAQRQLRLPAHATARFAVWVTPPGQGTFPFSATATANTSAGLASDSDNATLIVISDPTAITLAQTTARPGASHEQPFLALVTLAGLLTLLWYQRRRPRARQS